jgi:hypothetical protein
MVDLGSPLAGGQRLNVGGSSVDSDRDVTGYTVLQAESIEKVKELLRGHPHLSGWDDSCTIEVHEAMPLPSAM